MQKKLDEIANLWNKTKDPYYKDLWYQEVRRWAYVKDANNISFIIRRNSRSRKIRTWERDVSARMSDVWRRS